MLDAYHLNPILSEPLKSTRQRPIKLTIYIKKWLNDWLMTSWMSTAIPDRTTGQLTNWLAHWLTFWLMLTDWLAVFGVYEFLIKDEAEGLTSPIAGYGYMLALSWTCSAQVSPQSSGKVICTKQEQNLECINMYMYHIQHGAQFVRLWVSNLKVRIPVSSTADYE